MTAVERKLIAISDGSEAPVRKPSEIISERRSKELIIAFAGPIGSGINSVKTSLETILSNAGYDVKNIKISDYIRDCISGGLLRKAEIHTAGAERYIQLQDAGNELRKIQSDFLAEHAIRRIAEIRTERIGSTVADTIDAVPDRTAYIIDQLKHHEEVALLRAVYGNLFYLFGVFSTSPRREGRLKAEGIEPNRISELIERDRRQKDRFGQQLDKALQLADFFVRNDHSNVEALEKQLKRFADLIHGANGITPTREEYGMYAAYASGLRSACLSRQVGASIMNLDGAIISTGRNDVPKPGGGLYGPECESNDARCVKQEEAICHNDRRKLMLAKEVKDVIRKGLSKHFKQIKEERNEKFAVLDELDIPLISEKLASDAYEETRLGGLIEFSRSIHAEMDAIVSLALKGGGGTKDAVLFTYTFPCHNCARHIVAAGIKTVYFLEPYEKSLALELHSDAISIDGVGEALEDDAESRRVRFLHFQGVAPRQYLNMFSPAGERKESSTGKAVKINFRDADKKVPEYLDDYRQYEKKVVEHLVKVISDLKDKGLSSPT
ncbi:anti-phage dCTP deaminase [Aromatoleum diolicum]|nr:anti-phage dCTP deaminase [Aromatoleum diolicum]